MSGASNQPESTDAYLASLPDEVRQIAETIRDAIKRNAPDAIESISYGMPTYRLNGHPLVYFAAFKKHIGFYATPTGHHAFSRELSAYKQGKGSVQFPLNKPLPLDLISRIVKFRVEETLAKSKKK